jgi:hypothetical protein
MKIVKLHLDEKLYYRIQKSGYSYNELLALGIRIKQVFDIFEGRNADRENKTDCGLHND